MDPRPRNDPVFGYRHAALALCSCFAGCTGSLATEDASPESDATPGDAVSIDAVSADAAAHDAPPRDAAPGDAAADVDAYVDPCGDPSVIPTFVHGAWNPVLVPRSAVAAQGSDNIYAPDILRLGPHLCLMWYGGQGGDGHDRIFLATSTDCHHWKHYPDDQAPVAVVDNGTSNHVNDPSAGCDGCLVGQPECTTACRAAGFGIEGYCAHPGSTDPGAGCACVPLP